MFSRMLGLSLMLFVVGSMAADRGGPTGSAESSAGPKGGTTVQGDRSTDGNQASSTFSASGPGGRNASGSGSSTVKGNTVSGNASVATDVGRSASASGSAKITADGVSGSGSAETAGGRGVTASGSAAKTDEGVEATAELNTAGGQSASATVQGDQQSGNASVTTGRGTRSRDYNSANAGARQGRQRN